MNRNNLRLLGIGFLVSAILTAVFAIIVQGQPAIRGITINDLFSTDAQIESHKEEMSSLLEENSKLEANESALTKERDQLKSENESLKKDNQTSNNESDNSRTESQAEDAGDPAEGQPQVDGMFEIAEGSNATEIANQLEAEGYIESALEFNHLIEEWDLGGYIISGAYDLNSDMSIHDIANIITQGAYYY